MLCIYLLLVASHGKDESVGVAAVPAGAEQFVDVFNSYEVYLTAMVCVAGMAVTKHVLRAIKGEDFMHHPVAGLVMSVGNVPMGSLFGLIPDFLPGGSVAERMMVGAVAGFLANTLYGVIKRFTPNLVASDAEPIRLPVKAKPAGDNHGA